MSPSLRALLTGIVDYAGLFPPAKLPLEQAQPNYAQYRQSADQWMLGRFILPAARLAELAAFDMLFHERPPFRFAVLGRGGKTSDEFLTSLATDLTAIAEAHKRHAGRIAVDVLEVKLPDELLRPENEQAARTTLARTVEMLDNRGPGGIAGYFESAFGGDWRASLQVALGLLQRCRPAGFKLRCGGLEAAAYPSPEQVAAVIVGCRDRGVALKATAGLHHPLRHFNAGVQTHMHGFVNVFGGAVLAAVHGLDEECLARILADEEADHFVFDDTGFGWGNLWADVEQIRTVRQQFAIAFGSCSFDEPREDLQALGWWGSGKILG
jgi:hypothetical protein